jgi:UDPglucose 6-dehydrogenase/GDP-mannose 6-dehydrogenase
MLISFSNELSRIADTPALSAQVEIDRVLELVLLDRRWRDGAPGVLPSISQYLKSGCGFGGSCFPKDVAALAALARANHVSSPLLAGILPANRAAQAAWADRALAEAREFRGSRPKVIALLGLAFKPGTDDVRESPALGLIERIERSGARIQVHDPQARLPSSHQQSGRVAQVPDAKGALRGADACVLVTAWEEYKDLREGDFESLMRNPVLLDGRGLYRDRRFRRLRYVRIGTRA